MLSKFNEKAQKVIAVAESIAFDLGHSSVGTEHLLLSLLKVKESKLKALLSEEGLDFDVAKKHIIKLFGEQEVQPFYMEYTPSLKKIMEKSIIESKKVGEERASVDMLSFCLIDSECNVAIEILNQFHINLNNLKEKMKRDIKKVSELDNIADLVNLNKFATQNYNPLIGREKEISQLISTLLRKNKPNAILVGDPGVGKTAIVYELAYRISKNNVPDKLKNKTIYELDLAGVVAGTKYRGEFEEKLKKIIKKVKENANCILFIDEIHNIIGAGGAEGAIDASNIFKPYLSRGELQCIGATTDDEYVKIFEKEKALERRFQTLRIDEPTCEETRHLLTKILNQYQDFYNIEIDEKLMTDLVKYCNLYINNKFFPDKAIDILDYACVRCFQQNRKSLNKYDIIKVIEDNYKVHIDNQSKALVLKDLLNQKILGQEQAIQKIINQIEIIEAGLVEENRPLGVYMFIGPTGVGKTEIAKQIARSYFGDEKKLIKIDMTEFMDKESVTKLLGSPPGYVGFDQQSYLVEQIRKNPHSVVLIDEVEKAHKDILNVFLNVFDEGYFLDASKRKVNFCNSIIILTSNLGFGEEIFHHEGLGFVKNKTSRVEVNKALNKHFRPEFINRIDEIIYFDVLSDNVGETLVKEYINEFCSKVQMEPSCLYDEVYDILKASKIEKFGARAVKREVRKRISKKLQERSVNKITL